METPDNINPQISICWYCNRESAVDGRADRVDLYGNVVRSPDGQIAYQKTTVAIPRCAACARAHTVELWLSVLAFLIGGLAGMLLYSEFSEWLAKVTGWKIFVGILFVGFGVIGGVVGIFLVSSLSKLLLGDRRASTASRDYPAIHELLGRGWKIGSEPGKADVPAPAVK